jgi:hypothetical protein
MTPVISGVSASTHGTRETAVSAVVIYPIVMTEDVIASMAAVTVATGTVTAVTDSETHI